MESRWKMVIMELCNWESYRVMTAKVAASSFDTTAKSYLNPVA